MGVKSAPLRRVLVVDDEPAVTQFLKTVVEHDGRYDTRSAGDGMRAVELFKSWKPDYVLLDLVLPDIDGIALLRQLKGLDASPEVIVISGVGTLSRALEAGQAGAFYFLEKTNLDPAGLMSILDRATELHVERLEHERLKARVRDQFAFSNIVGKSKNMCELFELIDAVADSDANILVVGENGVGKELIANAIHVRSSRASGPFIKINCAALPKDLIESELFGYEKGAFTGATSDKAGLLELAAGGSLLLDEIGEMPLLLQTKLLRVLQEREYRPIASERLVKVDFRLICATNADPDGAVKDGRLREDLFFRINTVTLRVPPLRERTEDLPLLCAHFLETFSRRYRRNVRGISPAAYHLLIRYRWPGNVRELENAFERAVLVAKSPDVQPQDLPDSVRGDAAAEDAFTVPPHHTLAEIERIAVLQTLQRTNWNKQEAAQILGLYRPTLYSKIKKHRLKDPRLGMRAVEEA